ncbi:DNA gyrase inhibitor YacG [Propionivibrio sp.]|uniref:DNA gyrase inhibitor YacG n=1 Tax=Propionivibrio sp. TaxID=2212460 RepID=UPI0025FCE6D6|nr:DNA gyrase inhibitor YacG [Propionivibrio sp.]MBK7355299.1 DNA gyrase inhibitor YacG [Propionivibrio sp.]MBK8399694.1 DNA gyrase inhibitor YacG [Propionivibrio sp.]MBK8743410.1 DNA gyrase inhibitor YacG [Propionivibrio sp.]MBK8894566.1 DNA gyrase inhibitor YacG [Propionivibrio sp.]MBL0207049.1 DNA gyrase inhibitor YacG [Propionivibrio sp.]
MLGAGRKINCPQCGSESVWSVENPCRPFCCERCKLIDMGAWASEAYRVPVQESTDPLSESSPAGEAS